jgi:hypothetical protein
MLSIKMPILDKSWKYSTVLVIVLALLLITSLGGCSSTGTCVGSGGDILLSPVCKNYWTRSECREWDDMEVNGANWEYKGGTCERQGFTDECSDGSFRYPGDC